MNPIQSHIAKTPGTAALLGLMTAMPAAASPVILRGGRNVLAFFDPNHGQQLPGRFGWHQQWQ